MKPDETDQHRIAELLRNVRITTAEIDKLEAGRELDAMIARDVMGLPNVGWYRRTSAKAPGWQPCSPDDCTPDMPQWKASLFWWHGAIDSPRAIALYSTEIAPAWTVVEQMQSLGYDYSNHSLLNGKHKFKFGFSDLNAFDPIICNGFGMVTPSGPDPKDWDWPCDADSLPLAICRSALQAMAIRARTTNGG